MMAMVVILFSASILLLTALLQYVTALSGFTNEVVYRQIAQTAAKSAIEEGKDGFDGSDRFDLLDMNNDGTVDNDTNTNGTPDTLEEKTMFTNSSYRVTYQLTIKAGGTSADGRSKTVTGTGRVYLPASSATPRYTRTLNSEIIRSQIVSNDPSDFSPLAWYDASCGPPSTDPSCTLPTVLKTGTANVAANPISLREERKSDGGHCGGAPTVTSPADSLLSMTKLGECGANVEQRVGLLFNAGSGLAKGSTIQSAKVQFTSGGHDNTDVTLRIRGILTGNQAAFTTANSTQLSPTTSAYVDWTMGVWPNSSQSGLKEITPDLSAVIQEIINQGTWATGNNIGLVIECVSGSCNGQRRAQTAPITLNITYAGYVAAATNDTVQVWRDRSGNGFHLTAADVASRPTKSTVYQFPLSSAVNGKPMVRFTSGSSAMSASVPVSTGRKSDSYTTFAVISVRKSTADSDLNGVLSGNGNILSFYGAGTNNWAVVPYWRHPASGAVHTEGGIPATGKHVCQGGAVSTNYVFERQCVDLKLLTVGTTDTGPDGNGGSNWTILSNRSETNPIESLFRYHGLNSDPEVDTFDPMPLNAPYTIALGYNPRNGVKDAGFQVSEFIMYDRTLSCPQMEAVEYYLAQKWGYTDSSLYATSSKYASTGCRENNIPTF